MIRSTTQTEKKAGFWSALENLAIALDVPPFDNTYERSHLLKLQQEKLEIRIADLETRDSTLPTDNSLAPTYTLSKS